MPESKGRKKPAAKKQQVRRRPNVAIPRQSVLPAAPAIDDRTKPNRNPAREIPAEDRYQMPELPEPAEYVQVLVALADMDPLAQEVMIAQRLGVMPHPGAPDEGMPVPINRNCRAPWAHHLRKLGIFCIPELATHELVSPDRTGATIDYTKMSIRKIDQSDLWKIAKEQDPDLANLVDSAQTPEQKREAMKILAAKLPVQQRIAMEKLMAATPEDLEFK